MSQPFHMIREQLEEFREETRRQVRIEMYNEASEEYKEALRKESLTQYQRKNPLGKKKETKWGSTTFPLQSMPFSHMKAYPLPNLSNIISYEPLNPSSTKASLLLYKFVLNTPKTPSTNM